MATFDQIKQVRLKINDPAGFIDLESVGSLPSAAIPQTAYKLTTTGTYHGTDSVTPLTDDWFLLDLSVSDALISAAIDTDGVLYATCEALRLIIGQLGQKILVKKSDTGAESTEWTGLSDLMKYYQSMLADCVDQYNKSRAVAGSRWGGSQGAELYGGNV